ncbi:MAG: hypothetical protein H7A25_06005 [Leptospiraceae bacterium]|nr:hypothetical protein [Leptospiraceae bacterium]MCP5499436.1 hypothetical protein [Leptospiraceae bacterium]
MVLVLGELSFAQERIQVHPWGLDITERVINRKNVSHIVIESRKDHYRVTLLVSDRFPYNYKSQSYPFFFRKKNSEEAQKLVSYLDKFLQSGENLYIRLNGSEIVYHSALHRGTQR